ncbi:MAG: MaoC/PaaZ C-terminal domain-containing protein [Thermaerobacter sp.]|nr:MaoC/PaaZ C-terminal domain-containing protein [Thermaerobacter sp.]
MFTKTFEQYRMGDSWRSRGRTITEADLVMFAAFSGDWYPLHTDREWAAQGPFGQRIAHGMLVLSVATGLMVMDPGIVLAFYGMDRVRFVAPTFIGDTISVELAIAALTPKPKGGLVAASSTIRKQSGDAVAISTLKILVAAADEIRR